MRFGDCHERRGRRREMPVQVKAGAHGPREDLHGVTTCHQLTPPTIRGKNCNGRLCKAEVYLLVSIAVALRMLLPACCIN